jgi:transcriptional regulator with PAS, ATPase and Fis domain
VARALHNLSPLRGDKPFVTVTARAHRLESEPSATCGAFTGADRDRIGFSSRQRRHDLLDELGELPLGVQVKLLRVLENREIKRVGSPAAIQIDIRVIAATNRDLEEMVAAGTFRSDLFYRLNVGNIALPSLRERPDDIEPLVRHFITHCNTKLGRSVAGVSPRVLDLLQRYPWPGNVRELANVIERALVVARGTVVLPEHLPPLLLEARTDLLGRGGAPELSLEAAEREQILRALQASGGKRIEAARLLGLSRRTLYRKLDRYGIA